MRIAFDLRWVRSSRIDGVSRYALNLVSHLLQADAANEYLLLGERDVLQPRLKAHGAPARGTFIALPQRLLSGSDFLTTHRAIRRLGADILHVPHYLATPLATGARKILTVYDLIPFLFPDALSKSRLLWRLFYATPYPASLILRSADTIITTSENTKRDLIRLLHVPAERVQVVWCGIEERFQPLEHIAPAFRQRYGLPERFALYVGRQDPYKGLTYLVDAYAHLPAGLRAQYPLVLAGKTDERYLGPVRQLIASRDLHAQVRFLDYVPDADLPRLYAAATLLVHPSLYEGFGLPPLEAMACATPVVYADTSSLTELLGSAGLAAAPASADALAQGMRMVLEDARFAQELAARGLARARRYAWSDAAQQMLRLYGGVW
jgi:glycosyltransferase involved in cell wall biosynthesis